MNHKTASSFTTRFAPSPTGLLHRGHAFSALIAHDAARAAGGRFLVRIEDIDTERCRPEYAAAILEDIAWLGIAWDGAVVRQSERAGGYAAALDQLRARGLLYRCFRTRAEVLAAIGSAPHGPQSAFFGAPLEPAEEQRLVDAGAPFAWRLSLAAAEQALGGFRDLIFEDAGAGTTKADPSAVGDVILARKGLGVAYHLAAVVDDAAMGVTCVIRGEDLAPSCHIQRLLQALLGLPTPAYRHHRLILGPGGRRLAKRDGAETLRALRTAGTTPEALRAELGMSR